MKAFLSVVIFLAGYQSSSLAAVESFLKQGSIHLYVVDKKSSDSQEKLNETVKTFQVLYKEDFSLCEILIEGKKVQECILRKSPFFSNLVVYSSPFKIKLEQLLPKLFPENTVDGATEGQEFFLEDFYIEKFTHRFNHIYALRGDIEETLTFYHNYDDNKLLVVDLELEESLVQKD